MKHTSICGKQKIEGSPRQLKEAYERRAEGARKRRDKISEQISLNYAEHWSKKDK